MWTVENATGLALSSGTDRPRNFLLQALSSRGYQRLSPLLDRVILAPRRVVQHAQMPIEHLYFIEDGLVSVLASTGERNPVEIWLIGREGVVGSPALLGARTSPLRYFVQIGGSALRIAADDLHCAMSEMPELRAVLYGHLHATLMQSSQSAACSLRHSLVQRLARWLLTAQDRTGRDAIPITQDRLARSLGVRRATVSDALKPLERRGIFGRERGMIRILNRPRLEEIACRCYRLMCPKADIGARPETGNGRTRAPLYALPVICALLEVELMAQ